MGERFYLIVRKETLEEVFSDTFSERTLHHHLKTTCSSNGMNMI